MPFWIAAASLTFFACLAVLLPLARSREVIADGSDVMVYQDQLAELERDLARGAIDAAEAAEARTEISRRILRAAGQGRADAGAAGNARAGRIIATLAVLSVPLASWGIYAATGSPHLPAQPLAARLDGNPAQNTVFELVARAERHLADNPEDGRGWEVLAPIYQRIGRHEDAAAAWDHAIRLLGPTPTREVARGEAIASAAGGAITPAARAAFERALALDAGNLKARFLLAAALAQDDRADEAAAAFRAILADLPEASPWRTTIAAAISDLESGSQAGSAPAQNDAGGLILDKEQAEMVGEMVAGLDRRLRDNPDDAEGWQRLVRSYMVLQRPDEAADALARGIHALGAGSDAADGLLRFAAGIGVKTKD